MTTLEQINREFNASLNSLNEFISRQAATLTKLNSYTKKIRTQQLQTYYKQQLNILIGKKKQFLKQINKLVNSSLIVGINYIGTEYELNGCINDANNMRDFAIGRGCDNIIMLTDRDIRPSKTNILIALTNLLKKSNSGDVILFYYSGHGSNIKDNNGDEGD